MSIVNRNRLKIVPVTRSAVSSSTSSNFISDMMLSTKILYYYEWLHQFKLETS